MDKKPYVKPAITKTLLGDGKDVLTTSGENVFDGNVFDLEGYDDGYFE